MGFVHLITIYFQVIAIGPTTEKELVKQGLPVFGVAKQPDPCGVVEVLLKEKS